MARSCPITSAFEEKLETSSAGIAGMTERIDVDAPRWDQSTYLGRLKHFASITDPRVAFVPDSKLYAAKELLEAYKCAFGYISATSGRNRSRPRQRPNRFTMPSKSTAPLSIRTRANSKTSSVGCARMSTEVRCSAAP